LVPSTEALPPEPLALDVLAEPPALLVVLEEPPVPEELVVLSAPVVLDVVEVSLLLHAAPPATVAAVRAKKKRVRMINLLPGCAEV